MNLSEHIKAAIQDSIQTKEKVLNNHIDQIKAMANLWINCYKNKHKLLFCGNGGSASDSQHLATELMVRLRHTKNRPAMPAIALTTDTSLLTAGANDLGFDQIFARQIEGLGQHGDVLVALSTSGNSANVIEAVKIAKNKGIKVSGFLGNDGGKLAKLCDQSVIIPHTDSGRIQECHIMIGHILCDIVEQEIYGE
ncbi:MAG: D-sedoheptulose 7-phosphate isomerase [Calditrichaeota bacterium]|nr:D-sedoheptulose 7-phosphate isomerase [Calditrichota bacterium]